MEELTERLWSWASLLDEQAREQAERTSRLCDRDGRLVIAGHVALMPDAHWGLGSTVGSVIPTESVIIPSAVGVDIGCGMAAAQLALSAADLPDSLNGYLAQAQRDIPAGVGQGHLDPTPAAIAWIEANPAPTDLTEHQRRRALTQFGSLGSGNHFYEVCLDEHDRVWLVLHSGSRGIGNELAQIHIERAQALMRDAGVVLEDPALAYLAQGQPEFDAYIQDMQWAQAYAQSNRDAMMDRAIRGFARFTGHALDWERGGIEVERINCFAGETKVLTRTGSVSIRDVSGTSQELLSASGEWVVAPIEHFGRDRIWEVHLTRSGAQKLIRTTAAHRWFTQRVQTKSVLERRTDELRPGDRLVASFPHPLRPDVDGNGVRRGFVFGDGSSNASRAQANFCGAKDRALLPYFEGYRQPRAIPGGLRINGLPKHWKTELPSLNQSPGFLYGWLAGFFAADGDVGKTGRPTLSSSKRENLEHVRNVCTLLGIGTFGVRERKRKGYGTQVRSLFLLGLMRRDLTREFFLIPAHEQRWLSGCEAAERRSWRVASVNRTDDIEPVYCAVVSDGHAFTLEDNILTSNCHHNYTTRETHGGRELWITRKGAIRAGAGDRGVIPGSMGAASYIVEGLGNPASYESCSHGAGRLMSRGEAVRSLSADDLRRAMAGTVWQEGDAEYLVDESPMAYKPVDQVMADQRDLVRTVHTLRQIFNFKGVERGRRPRAKRTA